MTDLGVDDLLQTPAPGAAAEEPRARRAFANALLVMPLTAWILVFLAVPFIGFVVYSFWRNELFTVVRDASLDNYRLVLDEASYREVVRTSLEVGLLTAALTTALAYVLAWAIRFHAPRIGHLLVLAVVAASVGSYLARLYSWRAILGHDGLVNYMLGIADLGPTDALIFNRFAIVLSLTNVFLPFAFLPIYANLLGLERDTLDAGRVLGAGPVRTFLRVALPLSSVGLVTAFLYVLIFASSDFAASQFLGGPTGVVAASVIQEQFVTAFDWPLGSALAISYMLLLAVIIVPLSLFAVHRTRRVGA